MEANLEIFFSKWKNFCDKFERYVEFGVNIDMTVNELISHASIFDNVEVYYNHELKYRGTILELIDKSILSLTVERFDIKGNENVIRIKTK